MLIWLIVIGWVCIVGRLKLLIVIFVGIVSCGIVIFGICNGGKLKVFIVMGGIVIGGMVMEGIFSGGNWKLFMVMLVGVVVVGMFNDGSVIVGRLKVGIDIFGICSGGRVRLGVVILNCRLFCFMFW